MPRQKQLIIALQRIESKKPRLWQPSTNLSRSGLPGVQFPLGIIKHLLLLCIHVQIFEVHTVVVIHTCRTWGHIITHFWSTMYKRCNGPQPIHFRSVSCKCPEDNPDPWQCDGQEGSIWVWCPHDGAAWEQPWFPSDLTKIPHGCKLHCFCPVSMHRLSVGWCV